MVAVSKSFISTFLVTPYLVSSVRMELAALDEDLLRISDEDDCVEGIQVTLQTANDVFDVCVNPGDNVYESVAKELGSDLPIVIESVHFGGQEVSKEQSFSELGTEDGAKLSVTRKRATFEDFVRDVVELNPHISFDDLMQNSYLKLAMQVDPENPSRVLGNVFWYAMRIEKLPESIGDIEFTKNLDLAMNRLTDLPDAIGNLQVGGSLCLSDNQLKSVPDSIGNLEVGGLLTLGFNQLTSLPESIGNTRVGDNMHISHNKFTTMPRSLQDKYDEQGNHIR